MSARTHSPLRSEMNSERLVTRFRLFLLWLASALCAGVIAELWLTEHNQEWRQYIPFVLCGLGMITSLAVWWKPSRKTIWLLRIVMILSAFGGLYGIYEHLEGNLAFAQEINASQANAAPLLTALTGANPPLAPGALAVGALVAWAATYYHPALDIS